MVYRLHETSSFESLFHPIQLAKKESFVRAGEVCNKVGFLEQGILKYVYVRREQEVVDEFIFLENLVTYYRSFIASLNVSPETLSRIW